MRRPSLGPRPWAETVRSAHCVVVTGPGGVGKTSVSAALAIEGARQGRRTIVVTIDPARRLANALGLPEVGSTETFIPPEAFLQSGLTPPPGRLSAMMLDIKEAWDEVIKRYHPEVAVRDQLMNNRLYHALSTALAGSQEYMAMEKLHRLAHRTEDPLDLIVLDTPPARHALDFLEAPHRLMNALSNNATRWLLDPGVGARFFGLGRRSSGTSGHGLFFRTIARFTGTELLNDLSELLRAFSVMFHGFEERAQAVTALLNASSTEFLVVGRPSLSGLRDAQTFAEHLITREVNLTAVILNRATRDPFAEGERAPEALRAWAETSGISMDAVRRVEAVAEALSEDARSEAGRVQQFRADFRGRVAVGSLPELDSDVHDIHGLDTLRGALFANDLTETARN